MAAKPFVPNWSLSVSKSVRTETGHRLMNHDGKCRHLHGHSFLWTAEIYGDMDLETGMIMDFADLKEVMRRCIMVFDHRMLLHEDDPLIEAIGDGFGVVACKFHPTAEMLCMEVSQQIGAELYSVFRFNRSLDGWVVRVSVKETELSEASHVITLGVPL